MYVLVLYLYKCIHKGIYIGFLLCQNETTGSTCLSEATDRLHLYVPSPVQKQQEKFRPTDSSVTFPLPYKLDTVQLDHLSCELHIRM